MKPYIELIASRDRSRLLIFEIINPKMELNWEGPVASICFPDEAGKLPKLARVRGTDRSYISSKQNRAEELALTTRLLRNQFWVTSQYGRDKYYSVSFEDDSYYYTFKWPYHGVDTRYIMSIPYITFCLKEV